MHHVVPRASLFLALDPHKIAETHRRHECTILRRVQSSVPPRGHSVIENSVPAPHKLHAARVPRRSSLRRRSATLLRFRASMSLPDQTPKLPKYPFLVGDAALLATAWFIASRGHGPLSADAIIAIAACVAIGAILVAIPFLSDYARKQDEALDERQRGLEALSRTINTAAEQISIAANGLHEITELAHKNLKHAEQLPQKLHDKITEFNAQLDNAREDDREELEKELAELRASETERLQAAADKVHKAVADLAKLDAVAQKHLNTRAEILTSVGDAINRSHADATTALNEAVVAVTRELAAAQTQALAAIDAKLAERTATALAAIESAAARVPAVPLAPAVAPTPAFDPAPPATSAPEPAPAVSAAAAPEIASPPKRPRKSRREEPPVSPADAPPAPPPPEVSAPISPSEPAEPAATAETAEVSAPASSDSSAPALPPEPPPTSADDTAFPEPSPIRLETIPAVTPVAPASADPFTPPPISEPPPAEAVAASEPAPPNSPESIGAPDTPPPAPATERLPRKRPTRKPEPASTADLPLDLGSDEPPVSAPEDSPVTGADAIERVISSDGATRLIATAYIGIGNRLFIRGDGPGLSWEKGVPLQFVSIGKWRWETSDATAPIAFKLYKNDETECVALGRLTLDPGHQQEVAAKF